jgi:hypothetical protein
MQPNREERNKRAISSPFCKPSAYKSVRLHDIFFFLSFFLPKYVCLFLASIPICLYARSVFGAMEFQSAVCICFIFSISLFSIQSEW